MKIFMSIKYTVDEYRTKKGATMCHTPYQLEMVVPEPLSTRWVFYISLLPFYQHVAEKQPKLCQRTAADRARADAAGGAAQANAAQAAARLGRRCLGGPQLRRCRRSRSNRRPGRTGFGRTGSGHHSPG